jgi:DNA polymerase-4
VTIRDPQFKDLCRRKKLPAPSCVSREITDAALELVRASWHPGSPVRALTVTGLDLMPEQEAGEQLSLFSPEAVPKREKLERLERTMDGIRGKYGKSAVFFGSGFTGECREEPSNGEY